MFGDKQGEFVYEYWGLNGGKANSQLIFSSEYILCHLAFQRISTSYLPRPPGSKKVKKKTLDFFLFLFFFLGGGGLYCVLLRARNTLKTLRAESTLIVCLAALCELYLVKV